MPNWIKCREYGRWSLSYDIRKTIFRHTNVRKTKIKRTSKNKTMMGNKKNLKRRNRKTINKKRSKEYLPPFHPYIWTKVDHVT